MRAGGCDEIRLLPLHGAPRALLEDVAERLSRRVPVACRVVSAGGPEPRALAEREQVDAGALLAALEAFPIDERARLVGLTALDLGLPIFTFVFGLARSGGHAALVSAARLDPAFYGLPADAEVLARRAADEALHELGHGAGLPHCRDAACLMSFAGSVEKADVRGSAFCGSCQELLPAWLRGR